MRIVIYDKLLYPALSQTYMCVQLTDSTIRYPEGIAKNVLVCVRDSFILANFVVMDIEGNLGIELILGRPILRAARGRIDVGRGEIRFHLGKGNMFFRFKQSEEQRILNRQDDEGQTLWDAPESPPSRPMTTRSKKRRGTKVWHKVASPFSSNSPGRAKQW
jgi:hypothetical protein